MRENLFQLQDGSKSFGLKTLFDHASFAINEREHVGVIGPNGAGKTTLFRVIVGEETLDSGRIIRTKGLRAGYLSQHDGWESGETVESHLAHGTTLPTWELKSLGRGLGLSDDLYSRPLESLSGGYRMRVKLLRLLGQEPDLMLLDEPTNYLDLETLLVLEKFLQRYARSFLLISHDREFLRRTTDHILEVEDGQMTKFNGGIDDYFEQKELLRAQLEAHALSLEEKRAEVLAFVARFGAKATKASQAQSRLKSLAKMESIEVKSLPITARIRIPAPARVGKIVLKLEGLDLGYPKKKILSDVRFLLAGGEHLAVVGLNGAGKSTLLKTLAGRLEPLRGRIETGFESSFAFFNQHVAEDLDPSETVYRALERSAHADVLPQEILDLAGSLLFSGGDVRKPVRVLSGGEKSRVALGQVLLRKASCLILDEPTNHLDFATVEALTQALQAYAGALVVVSHDRGFIRRIGTKILEVDRGKTGLYPGTYDDYVWSLENGAFATLHDDAATFVPPSRSSPTPSAGAEAYERKKSLERRARQLDSQIARLEETLNESARRLAKLNEEIQRDADPARIREMGELQLGTEALEAQWLAAAEERDALKKT